MSAVMTAMFSECGTAERVLLELVRDGFPTDRVDLTSDGEPGRAGLAPARSAHERFVRHFRTLFSAQEERPLAERFADCIEHGGAAVTVHPRGTLETMRAHVILEQGAPLELIEHDLAHQALEHAAAPRETPWIRNFWIESDHPADCIYCRLFERE